MNKYSVLISRLSHGVIEVVAENREMAEEEALSESNKDKIEWVDADQYKIHEVSKIKTKCEKCGSVLPDESVFCFKCGAKIL